MGRIPSDAFERYVAMGADRSYSELARRLGVTKRAVTKRATKEQWQERLARIEEKARAHSDERLVEDLQAMNARHLKTLRALQAKALDGLRTLPMRTSADCTRALLASIKAERAVAQPVGGKESGTTLEDMLLHAHRRAQELDEGE